MRKIWVDLTPGGKNSYTHKKTLPKAIIFLVGHSSLSPQLSPVTLAPLPRNRNPPAPTLPLQLPPSPLSPVRLIQTSALTRARPLPSGASLSPLKCVSRSSVRRRVGFIVPCSLFLNFRVSFSTSCSLFLIPRVSFLTLYSCPSFLVPQISRKVFEFWISGVSKLVKLRNCKDIQLVEVKDM